MQRPHALTRLERCWSFLVTAKTYVLVRGVVLQPPTTCVHHERHNTLVDLDGPTKAIK